MTRIPKMQPEDTGILIVMIDHHLGNAVISLPVVARLSSFLNQPPDLMVDERYVGVFTRLPHVGRILAYPAQTRKRRGLWANIRPLGVLARLIAQRYRYVIDLTGVKRSAIAGAVTGAPVRITVRGRDRRLVYSHRLPTDLAPQGAHVLNRYSSVLACIGDSHCPAPVHLHPTPEAQTTMAELLARHQVEPKDPLVVVHAGAGKQWRQWPPERFAAAAGKLVERFASRTCIIGAANEQPLMDQVRAAMRWQSRTFTLSTSLDNLLALYDRAAVLLSNESGPTHLAATTHLPIVTIFGPAQEERWRPLRERDIVILRGADCDPRCRSQQCFAELRCVMGVSSEQMVDSASRFLEQACGKSQRRIRSLGLPQQ